MNVIQDRPQGNTIPESYIRGLSEENIQLQKAFFQRRVRHTALNRVIDDLMPLTMPHSESNLIIVTGATGVGKTAMVKEAVRKLTEEFSSLARGDAAVIPMIAVEAYANGSVRHGFKGLFDSLLGQLSECALDRKSVASEESGRIRMNPKSRDTAEGKRMILESSLRHRQTRIALIDEAAHLLRFGKDMAVMDTLKSLTNTTGVKWVLVGSFDLLKLVVENGQIARRAAVLNFDRYMKDSAEDRKEFRSTVQKLQLVWPVQPAPNWAAISDELMEYSLGCVGLLKSMMLDISAMQLRNGKRWDPRYLTRAVKSFKLINVIRKEIEEGEELVRDYVVGNSFLDQSTLDQLARKLEPA